MKYPRIIWLFNFFVFFTIANRMPAATQQDSMTSARSNNKKQPFAVTLFRQFEKASAPSKYFLTPQARVLYSMEIAFSGGSSYGPESSSGLLARFGIGLGDIAEMEFSTTQIMNQLSGEEIRFPSRLIKLCLLPKQYFDSSFLPGLAMQLRTTSWGSVAEREMGVLKGVAESFNDRYGGSYLEGLAFQSRFTTLYVVAGKAGQAGAIDVGMSLTDIRTKEGFQYVTLSIYPYMELIRIPEMQKNILAPFAGITVNANESTKIMAELSCLPSFEYDIPRKTVEIKKAWIGIGGVRFLMTRWFSIDGAVKYVSTYEGIADTEISLAANIVLPLKPR